MRMPVSKESSPNDANPSERGGFEDNFRLRRTRTGIVAFGSPTIAYAAPAPAKFSSRIPFRPNPRSPSAPSASPPTIWASE
jgi:hypothetical protein